MKFVWILKYACLVIFGNNLTVSTDTHIHGVLFMFVYNEWYVTRHLKFHVFDSGQDLQSCRSLDLLVMCIWKRLNSTGSLYMLSFAFVNLSEGQYWVQSHQSQFSNYSHTINSLYLRLMDSGSTLAIRKLLIWFKTIHVT